MKTIKKKDAVKCYKVTDSEMKCRGYQFELGKVYSEPKVEACVSGFHACVKLNDCFSYYDFNPNNRVFECTVWGKVDDSKGDNIAAQHIQFQKELSWHEVLELVNTGKHNTGRDNTGDRNTGDMNTGNRNTGDMNTGDRNTGDMNTGYWNTGYWNTGNRNTGYWNTGNRNTGDRNTGDRNTGDRNTGNWNTGYWNTGYRNTGNWNTGYWNTGYWNTGDRNTGDRNTGDRNTGNWNSTNYSTGFFNSIEQPIYVFNKRLSISRDEFIEHRGVQLLLDTTFPLTEWVPLSDIQEPTEEDKARDGRLVSRSHKEAWAILWSNLSDSEKQAVKTIPNFDVDVFEEITGIRVS
jgi:hypothetical protein